MSTTLCLKMNQEIANLMFLFFVLFTGVSASLQISGNYIEQYRFDFLFRVELCKVTGYKSWRDAERKWSRIPTYLKCQPDDDDDAIKNSRNPFSHYNNYLSSLKIPKNFKW